MFAALSYNSCFCFFKFFFFWYGIKERGTMSWEQYPFGQKTFTYWICYSQCCMYMWLRNVVRNVGEWWVACVNNYKTTVGYLLAWLILGDHVTVAVLTVEKSDLMPKLWSPTRFFCFGVLSLLQTEMPRITFSFICALVRLCRNK